MQDIKKITMDIDNSILSKINAKQNDTLSRFIEFNLFKNNVALNLTGHTVKIYAVKADSNIIFNNVTITDATNGKVLVELTSQSLAIVGDLLCELVIYGSDSSILSSEIFTVNVKKSLRSENVPQSANEISVFNLAITNMNNHIANTINPHATTKAQIGLGNVPNLDTSTTANITDSANKRFVTEAEKTKLSNTSGTNTGDQNLSGLQPKIIVDAGNIITATTVDDALQEVATKINTTQADVSSANYSELLTQTSNLFSLGVGKNASLVDINVSSKVVNGNINYSIEGNTDLVTFKSVGEDAGGVGVHKIDLLSRGKNRFNKSTVTGGYSIDSTTGLNTVNANYSAGDYIPVLASIPYILSGQGGSFSVAFYDTNKTFISGLANSTSFTTPANTAYLRFTLLTTSLATAQMEMATVATVFEDYTEDKISIKLTKPLKKVSATIMDKLSNAGTITRNISDWFTLDGSLAWTELIEGRVGGKNFYAGTPGSIAVGTVIKYDGKTLNNNNLIDGNAVIANRTYLPVGNTDTGFVDSYTPSSAEIKAYFYGWKMCKSDGSTWDGVATKYWKKITDSTGITSTLPTASYAGYTPYKMLYQLATPITEIANTDTAKPNEPTGLLPLLGFAGGSLSITSGVNPTFKYTVPLNFRAMSMDNSIDIKSMKTYISNLDAFTTAYLLNIEARLVAGGH